MSKTRFACVTRRKWTLHVHHLTLSCLSHCFLFRVQVWTACQWAPQASPLHPPDCQAVANDTHLVSQVCKHYVFTQPFHSMRLCLESHNSICWIKNTNIISVAHFLSDMEVILRYCAFYLSAGPSSYSSSTPRYYKWPSQDVTPQSSLPVFCVQSSQFSRS